MVGESVLFEPEPGAGPGAAFPRDAVQRGQAEVTLSLPRFTNISPKCISGAPGLGAAQAPWAGWSKLRVVVLFWRGF